MENDHESAVDVSKAILVHSKSESEKNLARAYLEMCEMYEHALRMEGEMRSALYEQTARTDKAERERDEARHLADVVRKQSWDDFYKEETCWDDETLAEHGMTDDEAMKSECEFLWDK